jgi:aryl-alcohol dehydrogenase-like predicted oxidoreductase
MHNMNRRTFLGGALASALRAAAPPRVRFGKTGLMVSRLCQGTAFRKNRRDPDDPNAQRVLHRCLDIGVNFFDSSNAYGWGGSELALGRAIRGRRDQVIICTKVHPALKPAGAEEAKRVPFTREFAVREAEGSLKRLGTDYIDLYLLHNPDGVTPVEEVAATMDSLVRSGKIRYWGVSNHSPKQVSDLAALRGGAPIAGIENYYNIVYRDLESEMFPVLRRTGLGLLPFSPLDEGRLLAPEAAKDERKARLLEVVDGVGREVGAGRAQVLIAWVLSHPEATCVLAGAEEPAHVEENVKATALALPDLAVARLNQASSGFRG